MARRAGFEPATCPLGGDRAIQLCQRRVSAYSNKLSDLSKEKQITIC